MTTTKSSVIATATQLDMGALHDHFDKGIEQIGDDTGEQEGQDRVPKGQNAGSTGDDHQRQYK